MKWLNKICCAFLIVCLLIPCKAVPVFAYSYTLATCPNSEGETTTRRQKLAHEGHIGDNYTASMQYNGYYVIFYEDWDCSLCGYHVSKQTIMTPGAVSIDPVLEEE